MDKLLIVLVVILGIVAIAQLVRVYELSSKLRGNKEEEISQGDNRMNANLMLVFMFLFYGFFFYNLFEYKDLILPKAASAHGEDMDWLLYLNLGIIITVFFFTNTLLFFFANKYYYREDRKALYYPHNNKLELLWTVVPAAVLAVIIILGLKTWNEIVSEDEEAIKIELYSKQFSWTARYAGADNVLGIGDVKLVELGSIMNPLGVVTSETIEDKINVIDDQIEANKEMLENTVVSESRGIEIERFISRLELQKSRIEQIKARIDSIPEEAEKYASAYDDLMNVAGEICLIKGQAYEFNFRSQDVIHSAYFPYHRAQMNTVPGMVTKFTFTPTQTTEEKRAELNNPEFDYVLMCNKICGKGHSNMQMKVTVVESQDDFDAWVKEKNLKTLAEMLSGESSPAEETVAENSETEEESK